MNQKSLQCALVRGGTSKGLFILEENLPAEDTDEALLSVFGSPDARQIDGIGGATTTTSKLVIVRPSARPEIDISYTFGQVSIEDEGIDYGGNCGNMASGVGPFAVDEGLVNPTATDEEITIRLYNTNTESTLDQKIPLSDGTTATKGDYRIDGVPGTGPRIETTFHNPGGALTGELFPLGGPRTELSIDGRTIEVSVVDVTTPVVFVRASTLGLNGTEHPSEVTTQEGLMELIERIRGEVCVRLGFVDNPSESMSASPNEPKLAFVRSPTTYRATDGSRVTADEIDLVSRVTSIPVMHPTYAVTSACCTAAAVNLSGTIPYEVAAKNANTVTFGHPKGKMSVRAAVDENRPKVNSVTVGRTQRRLMEGVAYY